ncbi:MAG: glutathione S-transferase N-terminal domain-containing protein [Deltaproteobacteria bacterium]|jgi:glutathione S-transferase|nr:glutathione S-transferase N-terminal domain-containing protein [Deltaproteobacteria bacterium]MBW2382713.1 glutathione S-transferase N-terminal domain-containing protein [Deltaproteobacteria bacterium]MBW2694948.1 glutathione S-transferase N-terminal domain-containing protein [Deltaproteobacteria bacterium]
MSRALDVSTSYLVSVGRLGAGMRVAPLGERPSQTLILYDFEACPFCRKVREALSSLDLEAEIRPCPKGGRRYRDELVARGGKAQFPYLVDPGIGIEMYESDDIVRHLFDRYGDGSVPLSLGLGLLTDLNSMLAGMARLGAGSRVKPSRAPEQALELYSMEASPYCRLVRETLCELELPYRLHNVGKGSPSREAFVKRSGLMRVPWLSDSNTGTELFESADIVRYLTETYAAD